MLILIIIVIIMIILMIIIPTIMMPTAVEQAVACTPVTQRARVRYPVGTSFLGEFFFRFFLTFKTNVRKLWAHKVPEYHLAIIIIIFIFALLE